MDEYTDKRLNEIVEMLRSAVPGDGLRLGIAARHFVPLLDVARERNQLLAASRSKGEPTPSPDGVVWRKYPSPAQLTAMHRRAQRAEKKAKAMEDQRDRLMKNGLRMRKAIIKLETKIPSSKSFQLFDFFSGNRISEEWTKLMRKCLIAADNFMCRAGGLHLKFQENEANPHSNNSPTAGRDPVGDSTKSNRGPAGRGGCWEG